MGHRINPKTTPPRGFTLIELLVVVSVLSVLAVSGAMLAARSGGRSEGDASLFRDQFKSLRQIAITSGQTRGLSVDGDRLRLARRDAAGWVISDTPIRLSGRAIVSLRQPGGSTPQADAPEILVLASGQTTAFTVTLGAVRCEADGWSDLTCNK